MHKFHSKHTMAPHGVVVQPPCKHPLQYCESVSIRAATMPKPRQAYSYVEDWKSLWEPDLEAIAYNGQTCDPTRVDPKVLQWAKRISHLTPHFIKIINENATIGRLGLQHGLKNASCCRLVVPKPFVKEHFRELQRVVTLENDEGKTWRVSFGSARRSPWWQQGWRRVTADNDFKPGEVIVFVLVANFRFRFTRFDEDGNLIGAVKEEPTILRSPEQSQPRTSWKAKRAAALASRVDRCAQPSGLEFDGYGHEGPQLSAPADQHLAEVYDKRRRLLKVGEIKSKASSSKEVDLGIGNGHSHDSEEAGSASTADSPSIAAVVTSHPAKKHMSWHDL